MVRFWISFFVATNSFFFLIMLNVENSTNVGSPILDDNVWPSSAGLLFGLACVGVGQIVVFLYYLIRRYAMNSKVFVSILFRYVF